MRLTIDGRNVEAAEGMTILAAAKTAGIEIPTLCYLEGISDIGACRLCVVEVEGKNELATACNTKVKEGMVVQTASRKVIDARKTVLKLLLSNHNIDCFNCEKNGDCQLQKYCNKYDIDTVQLEHRITHHLLYLRKIHPWKNERRSFRADGYAPRNQAPPQISAGAAGAVLAIVCAAAARRGLFDYLPLYSPVRRADRLPRLSPAQRLFGLHMGGAEAL